MIFPRASRLLLFHPRTFLLRILPVKNHLSPLQKICLRLSPLFWRIFCMSGLITFWLFNQKPNWIILICRHFCVKRYFVKSIAVSFGCRIVFSSQVTIQQPKISIFKLSTDTLLFWRKIWNKVRFQFFPKVDIKCLRGDLKNPSKRRIFRKGDKQFLTGKDKKYSWICLVCSSARTM